MKYTVPINALGHFQGEQIYTTKADTHASCWRSSWTFFVHLLPMGLHCPVPVSNTRNILGLAHPLEYETEGYVWAGGPPNHWVLWRAEKGGNFKRKLSRSYVCSCHLGRTYRERHNCRALFHSLVVSRRELQSCSDA